jgi:FAD/FMN-containing dehydrogenase
MRLVHREVELAAMGAVKRIFDPDGLFNPGKVLPDAEVGVVEVDLTAAYA